MGEARKVTSRDVIAAAQILPALDAVIDTSGPTYFVPGQFPIHHVDGWLIGEAIYEDDQWWVDFSRYGDDVEAPTNGRQFSVEGDGS